MKKFKLFEINNSIKMHGVNNNVKFVDAREAKGVNFYRNAKDTIFLKPLCSAYCWKFFYINNLIKKNGENNNVKFIYY